MVMKPIAMRKTCQEVGTGSYNPVMRLLADHNFGVWYLFWGGEYGHALKLPLGPRSRSQPSKIEFGLMPPTWIPMAITSEWALPVPSWGCCPLLFSHPAAPFASSVSVAAGVLLRLLAMDRMRRAIAVWLTLALFLAVWPDCRIFQWVSLQFQLISASR